VNELGGTPPGPAAALNTVTRTLRRMLPRPLKSFLKNRWNEARFHAACRKLLALPQGEALPVPLIEQLRSSWDNEGMAASTTLLQALARLIPQHRHGILECGSGLTTIVMGALTRGTGRRVVALEHMPDWALRVQGVLDRLGLGHVQVVHSALEEFEDFAWYEVEPTHIAGPFDLVLCDGPPARTFGGRRGLLPRMQSLLEPGAVILFDDPNVPSEQETLRTWQARFAIRYRLEGSETGTPVAIIDGL
jgi:predicted O-methyltransferase YrrM